MADFECPQCGSKVENVDTATCVTHGKLEPIEGSTVHCDLGPVLQEA